MSEKSFVEQWAQNPENMRLLQQERLILEVTGRICQLMGDKEINRKELADLLGTTKGYITQLLDGRANMTLRKIADVFTALGEAASVTTQSLESTIRPTMTVAEGPANWQRSSNVVWPESLKVETGPKTEAA